ncbi:MAG: peptidylprolyl isomerase [Desulfurococcales archaeon]|nr:peptidylprolyl isomerase [Desulfurococcales archaeon]
MAKPGKNDLVLIEYSMWAENGKKELVDTTDEEIAKKEGKYDPNRKYGPIPVVLGSGSLLEPVEQALYDMEEGEEKEIVIPPEKGYGERREDLVVRVSRKRLREAGIRAAVGEEVEIGGRKGRIIRVTERFVFIDFNHPLAGKKLYVRLALKRIVKSDEEKIKLLAVRYLRLPEDAIKVEKAGEGEYVLVLPSETLLLRDLEAILLSMLESIYKMTGARKIRIAIDVEFKREEKEEEAAEEGATGESSEGEGASQ